MASGKSPFWAMLSQWREVGHLRALDWHFAKLLAGCGACDEVVLAGALTSAALSVGHSCLPLLELETKLQELDCPLQMNWRDALSQSSCVGEHQPLVFDQSRIYLNRYWQFEKALAERLTVEGLARPPAPSKVKPILNRLFGNATQGEVDWQRVAVAQACCQRFLVISGGPGCGKTTTVTRLLALLQELSLKKQGRALEIALVAPTGKAAARLSESILNARMKLDCSEAVQLAIPARASTIHRLLGVIPGRQEFRHDAHNPLLLDLLVVDEASMIDLPLMARLFDALTPTTRVVLLGDRDQLASVDAGSVLADICQFIDQGQSPKLVDYLQRCGAPCEQEANAQALPIADNLVMLRKSYRFSERSGIGQLARAVNQGESTKGLRYLNNEQYNDIDWRPLSEESYRYALDSAEQSCQLYLDALHRSAPMSEVFSLFKQFQLLVALRQGDFGVEGINQRLQRQLYQRGLLEASIGWCAGLPLMVESNDHHQQLYNGDIGIMVEHSNGTLMVAFEDSEAEHGIRWVLPSRLPEHQSVFAMTVHKSQGSEFTRVLMLLPPNGAGSPSRELLYTGITRARNQFSLIADEVSFKRACGHCTTRFSGLASRLSE